MDENQIMDPAGDMTAIEEKPADNGEMPELIEEERSPWAYIITLYLPFGLLMGLTNMPLGLFKLINFSNQKIGLLTGLGLVASFRFVFAPWLDGATTKRRLSLVTLISAAVLAFAATAIIYSQKAETVSPQSANILLWSLGAVMFCFWVTSASHETAADGYYIRALNPKRQAEFIGIKTMAIRGGVVFASMVLGLGAAKIAAHYGAIGVESPDKSGFFIGNTLAYLVGGFMMVIFAIYNKYMIPRIPQDKPVHHGRFALYEVLKEYLLQKRVALMILMIVLFRFGEGYLAMKGPFYLDPLDKGGLASEATDMPYYSMLTDLPWMIIGGVLGGYMIKWWGLKRTFIPLALCMNLPNLFYVWLAWKQPMTQVHLFGETLNLGLLFGSSIESLGYGLSFSAMFYYMHIMATESGRNKTAILAVSMAIMNVGWTLPSMTSGFVQGWIGYTGCFIVSSTVGMTALCVIPFLPMPKAEQKQT
jgi:PAT family beta-lactamase induction signal transducer AmpG